MQQLKGEYFADMLEVARISFMENWYIHLG